MIRLSMPSISRRFALGTAVLCIVGGSHLGMLWLAHVFAHGGREQDFVTTPEALFGSVAIAFTLITTRIRGIRFVLGDPILPFLLLFLVASTIGELLRPDFRLGAVTTFISLGAFYLVGSATGRWASFRRARLPMLTSLLTVYTLWYFGLAIFYFTGDLGFFSELRDTSDVLRLEFFEGYTATEIPMWIGLHLPVLIYTLFGGYSIMIRLWSSILIICAATVVYLSASIAAMVSFIIVLIIFMIALYGITLRTIGRVLLIIGFVMIVFLTHIGNELVESTNSKLSQFLVGQGTRAIVYTDLFNRIIEKPMGIGKGRFVEVNDFWQGKGIYPHNNLLGIGAELGIIPLCLYMAFSIAVLYRIGRISLVLNPSLTLRLRLLASVALCIFLFQQLRGLFHDTWTLKEIYFWIGLAAGAIAKQKLEIINGEKRSLHPNKTVKV